MKKAIWLSYDLNIVSGDFEGLFKLLDSLEAKECGECLAFFEIEVSSDDEVEDKVRKLIEENVNLSEGDRIYIIYPKMEGGTKKIKGKFLFGKRKKTPPWKGYATVEAGEEEG